MIEKSKQSHTSMTSPTGQLINCGNWDTNLSSPILRENRAVCSGRVFCRASTGHWLFANKNSRVWWCPYPCFKPNIYQWISCPTYLLQQSTNVFVSLFVMCQCFNHVARWFNYDEISAFCLEYIMSREWWSEGRKFWWWFLSWDIDHKSGTTMKALILNMWASFISIWSWTWKQSSCLLSCIRIVWQFL